MDEGVRTMLRKRYKLVMAVMVALIMATMHYLASFGIEYKVGDVTFTPRSVRYWRFGRVEYAGQPFWCADYGFIRIWRVDRTL